MKHLQSPSYINNEQHTYKNKSSWTILQVLMENAALLKQKGAS